MAIMLSQTIVYGQQLAALTNQLNKNLEEALSTCHVNTRSTFIVTSTLSMTNKSIIIDLSLSNNYNVRISINLANNVLPTSGINITVITSNGNECYTTNIPITVITGNYNYTVLNTEYFTEILSYTGPTPIVTNSTNSLETYGTKINSAIIIPKITGYIICNTGSLSTPIYLITVLNRPIMYFIQPAKTSLLCRYSQNISSSYLLMALLIGAAAALIYESIFLLIRVRGLSITQ